MTDKKDCKYYRKDYGGSYCGLKGYPIRCDECKEDEKVKE